MRHTTRIGLLAVRARGRSVPLVARPLAIGAAPRAFDTEGVAASAGLVERVAARRSRRRRRRRRAALETELLLVELALVVLVTALEEAADARHHRVVGAVHLRGQKERHSVVRRRRGQARVVVVLDARPGRRSR